MCVDVNLLNVVFYLVLVVVLDLGGFLLDVCDPLVSFFPSLIVLIIVTQDS